MDGEIYRLPGRRSERRQIWGATIIGLLLAAGVASSVATQWIAHVQGHRPQLGIPTFEPDPTTSRQLLAAAAVSVVVWAVGWARGRTGLGWWGWLVAAFLLAGLALVSLHRPDGAWRWARAGLVTEPLLRAASIAGGAAFAVLALWIGAWAHQSLARVPKAGETHGSAHYATPAEVKATGFLNRAEDGVVLGSYRGRRLKSLKDQHVLLFSPPGAGKSTALAVPTLLTWRGSVFVLDAKSELFRLTAAYRHEALGQDVCRMDFTASSKEPADRHVARFNPLLTIPQDDRQVAEAQAVAELLVGPAEGRGGEGFWRDRAQELLVALILHTLYVERQPTLARCRERLREGPIEHLLAEMILTEHDTEGGIGWFGSGGRETLTHPEVAGTARSLLGMAEETRSGILAHVEQALRLFGDSRLANNTSTTDVTASDLMDRERPVSLYLTLPGGEVERLEPMLRLVLSQWLRELLNREVPTDPTNPPYRHRLLLLLDEFPLFGKLKFLEKAGAALRGYGIQLYVIVQSVTQLKAIYGNQETISGICGIHLTMGATDLETAKRISERLGKVTVETERSSVATSGPSRKTLAEGEHARPLLAPDEVARLPEDRLLVLPLGHAPILGERVAYFRDREMRRRVGIGPLEPGSLWRFEHDWRRWTEHQARRPSREEIGHFLAKWKRNGVIARSAASLKAS
ncbi:MAG: type IV secretory system conjugative DNA transfer family protein [bacterium]|nr:type IV secretory system conjugative DNA transfer family protein [bacterium]